MNGKKVSTKDDHSVAILKAMEEKMRNGKTPGITNDGQRGLDTLSTGDAGRS